jgi:hypothetical protein
MSTVSDDELALTQRFWAKVERSEGCWLWRGTRTRAGYGTICVRKKVKRATHVLAFLLTGEWPEACMCHRCDNPPCVNPDHLFHGTIADNNHDRHRKGRTKIRPPKPEQVARGEKSGPSKLTDEAVREIRKSQQTQRALAARYGVDQRAIWQIRNGHTWRHVS